MKRGRVIYPRSMEHQNYYCVHCLKTVPGVPVRNDELFKQHLLEVHGIKYVEKKKVEKNVKAETHVLNSLSIAPGITIVNESEPVKKQSPIKSLLLRCMLCDYTCETSIDLKKHSQIKHKMPSNSGQNTVSEMASLIKDSNPKPVAKIASKFRSEQQVTQSSLLGDLLISQSDFLKPVDLSKVVPKDSKKFQVRNSSFRNNFPWW